MYRVLSLLLLSTIAFALPEDNKQPLHIQADTSTYNYKSGINIFEGNVKVDQGTTHVTADRMSTKSNAQHKIQEVIAYGVQRQAHYWTHVKPKEPEFHAIADIIKFYPIVSNVSLEKHVFVKQGENSFHGELIHYNGGDQTITVPALDKSRAVLVYNPD